MAAAASALSEGKYREGHLSEDEMWSAFAYAFSPKAKHAANYKYGFLKSILDNLYNTDDNIAIPFTI